MLVSFNFLNIDELRLGFYMTPAEDENGEMQILSLGFLIFEIELSIYY